MKRIAAAIAIAIATSAQAFEVAYFTQQVDVTGYRVAVWTNQEWIEMYYRARMPDGSVGESSGYIKTADKKPVPASDLKARIDAAFGRYITAANNVAAKVAEAQRKAAYGDSPAVSVIAEAGLAEAAKARAAWTELNTLGAVALSADLARFPSWISAQQNALLSAVLRAQTVDAMRGY